MTKKIENVFKNKFHLLYSQESTEKIIWSSSDSSDCENVNHKENIEYRKHSPNTRKRKRRSSKLKNIPNLDVVYDEDKQKNQLTNTIKSPIIKIKSTPCLSPVLSKPQKYVDKDLQKSPILSIPSDIHSCKTIKSPILKSRNLSPIQNPNVRKKLFACKDRSLHQTTHTTKEDWCNKSILQESKETSRETPTNITSESKFSTVGICFRQNSRPANEETASKSADLVKRVKLYFDNHFNSQASSQNSISEYESTPQSTSKTIDDIDTISSIDDYEKLSTDMISSKDSSLELDDTQISKTLKLKKDGLAHRLYSLLKKHNANISMWLNEKFLADTSKFPLPKGDVTILRIQKVQLKYGCYLLEAKDVDDNSFSVIINTLHVNNVNLEANALLKLYKPYDCVTIDSRNVIVNVFKFECDNNYKPK